MESHELNLSMLSIDSTAGFVDDAVGNFVQQRSHERGNNQPAGGSDAADNRAGILARGSYGSVRDNRVLTMGSRPSPFWLVRRLPATRGGTLTFLRMTAGIEQP